MLAAEAAVAEGTGLAAGPHVGWLDAAAERDGHLANSLALALGLDKPFDEGRLVTTAIELQRA